MSLFKKIGGLFGLSGSADAGRRAAGDLAAIGQQLKNFTPLRIRSAAGTGTYDQGGMNFDLDPRLAAGAGSAMDFFGNASKQLADFNSGDATARTLALLRARRATQFNSDLGRMESRLLQQGRLGLATGARAVNPEMASFFGAEADADLMAQLAAGEETRKERAGLMDAANGGLNLAMSSAMPTQFMQGLFNLGAMQSSRDIAAANVAAGGPALAMKGEEADRGARASFFGNVIKGVGQAGGFAKVASLFSDRRLKHNIRRVGVHPSGLAWYKFDYVWGESSEGVMADEARAVAPHAVRTVAGFDVVNYGAL